jgi:pimeloyl-ACP methyl ester carboxylesterase
MPVFEKLTAFGFSASGNVPYRYWLLGDTRLPVIVLLAGYTSEHSSFQKLAVYLKKQYCVLIPDLPGWENTESVPWSVREYTEYLKSMLDFLGLASVSLVGHCVGNALVVDFAEVNPSRVKEVFLVSVPQMEGFFATPVLVRSKLLETVKQHMAKQSRHLPAALEKHWESYLTVSFHRVSRLPVVVHLIHGSNDSFVRPHKAYRLRGSSERVTWDVVLGAGHLPGVERPEALAAVILGYFHAQRGRQRSRLASSAKNQKVSRTIRKAILSGKLKQLLHK